MAAKLPAVLVTLVETQQFLPELKGSTMYHQPPSEVLPTICEVCPTLNPLSTTHAVPGPRRQLTATSFGNATGTVGVEVSVGGAVFVGKGVSVGVSAGKGSVADGVTTAVGVSVIGAFDGRLQAASAKTRVSTNNRLRNISVSLLF